MTVYATCPRCYGDVFVEDGTEECPGCGEPVDHDAVAAVETAEVRR